MLEKVITKEALLYFSQQFYSKISNTFARKSHTHTSLASKEHNHIATNVSLNDGRDLESAFTELESKIEPTTNIVLSSSNGTNYKLVVDDDGILHTMEIYDVEPINKEIIINGFALTIDNDGRLITTKK